LKRVLEVIFRLIIIIIIIIIITCTPDPIRPSRRGHDLTNYGGKEESDEPGRGLSGRVWSVTKKDTKHTQ